MGILDSKTRVVDTVITQQGRAALASGRLKIAYYTFTDADVFYQEGQPGVADDVTVRLCQEAHGSDYNDQITLVANNVGLVNFTGFQSNLQLHNGQLLQYSASAAPGSYFGYLGEVVKGPNFSSQINGILTSSFDNIGRAQVISSRNNIFDDNDFYLTANDVTFKVKNSNPDMPSALYDADVNAINDVVHDRKFANIDNFKFLPPIRKLPSGLKASQLSLQDLVTNYGLGSYSSTQQYTSLTYSDLKAGFLTSDNVGNFRGLDASDSSGFLQTIDFLGSGQATKVAMNMFEVAGPSGNEVVRKLDCLDLGLLKTDDPNRPMAHVFFIGKVLTDELSRDTFLHIFTLVLD